MPSFKKIVYSKTFLYYLKCWMVGIPCSILPQFVIIILYIILKIARFCDIHTTIYDYLFVSKTFSMCLATLTCSRGKTTIYSDTIYCNAFPCSLELKIFSFLWCSDLLNFSIVSLTLFLEWKATENNNKLNFLNVRLYYSYYA